MAKSGSHVLSQFLQGLSTISPLIYTDMHPVRTRTPEDEATAVNEVLHQTCGGCAQETLAGVTCRHWMSRSLRGRAMWFCSSTRDPRDKMVSQIHYATGIHEGHAFRQTYLRHGDDGGADSSSHLWRPGLVPRVSPTFTGRMRLLAFSPSHASRSIRGHDLRTVQRRSGACSTACGRRGRRSLWTTQRRYLSRSSHVPTPVAYVPLRAAWGVASGLHGQERVHLQACDRRSGPALGLRAWAGQGPSGVNGPGVASGPQSLVEAKDDGDPSSRSGYRPRTSHLLHCRHLRQS